MQATIGALEFIGDAGPATYTLESLTGWLDGVETRHDRVDRQGADGEHNVPGYLTGRLVAIEGLIKTPDDPEAFEAAMTALSSISPTVPAALTVETALGTTTAMVRRFGKPSIVVVAYGRLARYRIQFWSPEAVRYGATHTYGPLATVTGIEHDGNYPAYASLQIAGSSGGGYTVTGPGGETIVVTRALASGHPHTIDLATGALFVDGARVLGGVTVFEPWTVPVGSAVSASVSAGTLTVTVKDTFA